MHVQGSRVRFAGLVNSPIVELLPIMLTYPFDLDPFTPPLLKIIVDRVVNYFYIVFFFCFKTEIVGSR